MQTEQMQTTMQNDTASGLTARMRFIRSRRSTTLLPSAGGVAAHAGKAALAAATAASVSA